MNQQPDKLFRDKLYGYTKPVSSEAWARIAEQQKRQNRKFLSLKVAASILFVMVSGFLIAPYLKNTPEPLIAEQRTPDNSTVPLTGNSDGKAIESAKAEGEIRSSPADKVPSQKPEKKVSKEAIETREVDKEKSESQAPVLTPVLDSNVHLADNHHDDTLSKDVPPRQVAARERNVTIVFTAEEVNEKYLTKEAIAEATSDKEESSTLKRVLEKAYDLTHDQDPLGNLRQKKNQILALNFKNDKQRNEN